MRLVQMRVPADRQDEILDLLEERQFGYTVVDGAGPQHNHVVVDFVTPADAVEQVLEDLEEQGFDRSTYTVSVATEFANFEHVDAVQNRWAETPNRLAASALRSKAKDLRLNMRGYVWMMVLSAVVATAGLLLASPAVVVGSMVLAPIVSPMLTGAVGAVRDDRDMLIHSIHMQAIGIATAIVAATVLALVIQRLQIVPVELTVEQLELVSLRLSPNILAIVIGVAAGAAGTFGLATKGQVSIVGVMIAAALIPTAGAVGIALAWGNLVVATGALLLLVLTIVGVNAGATAMLFYLDYRPDHVDESILDLEGPREIVVVGGTLLALLVTVVVGGGFFYQQSSFERSVNAATTDVLEEPRYRDLGLRGTTIEYTAASVSDRTTITLTLVRTTDRDYPDLPGALAQAIADRTDRTVLVRVRYITYDSSDATASRRLRERIASAQ